MRDTHLFLLRFLSCRKTVENGVKLRMPRNTQIDVWVRLTQVVVSVILKTFVHQVNGAGEEADEGASNFSYPG